MIGNEKIWELVEYDEMKASRLADDLQISPLVTSIMLQRGLEDLDMMRDFLYGKPEPFYDPFLMKGMQKAVHRIREAMENGEKITIYGDYDVDGITATSVLYIYLKQQGAVVETYIPKRENEGYGLNDRAIKQIADNGTTLLITVDCGISCCGEVARAPQGLDIIVTDHHTVPAEIPDAYAVIDPKQQDCGYPCDKLCGAGIAFKICQALELGAGRGYWEGLLEIVALGTVADIVPLVDENREIVRRGLKAMEHTTNIGLQALIKLSGCPTKKINSEHVGFILAPRLNAVGRLAHAMEAVELLTTEDPDKAELIAERLNRANEERKDISNQIQQEAEAMLEERQHLDTCIVLASPNWHPGVIGIVASRMVDKHNLPTILMSISNGVAKGSCRSIASLNLYEAIAAQSDLLSQFGGHHQAAGLTLPEENLPEFIRRFTEYVRNKLQPEDYIPRQKINVLLKYKTHIGLKDLDQLELLEPFGCENLTPVFAYSQAQLQSFRVMGKNQEHLSFTLNKGYDSYKVLMWNHAYLMPCLYENMVADIAFVPRKNTWNDETTVQLHGLSLRQGRIIQDERQNVNPKEEVLRRLLNSNDRKAVVFRQLPAETEKVSQLLQEAAAEVLTYEQLLQQELPSTLIFYEVPSILLTELLKGMDKRVKNIVLLFNGKDAYAAMTEIYLTHPRREEMARAYKLVMNAFSGCRELVPQQLLDTYPDRISKNMLRIMVELEFLTVQQRLLYKSENIRRRNLEESGLYCRLQEERNRIIYIYNENMRLTQSELLRGKRD